MKNNFKDITNQPVDRYYSPKIAVIGDSFSNLLSLLHIKEQQIYSSKINLGIGFTFLARFCK
jgi:hypothetical protein